MDETPKIKPKPRASKPRPARGESQPRSATSPTQPPPVDARDIAAEAGAERSRRTGKDRKLAEGLATFYTIAGVSLTGLGQATGNVGVAVAGVNVASRAEDTAEAWLVLADSNPRVRRVLEGFLEGGALAGVIGEHVAMFAVLAMARQDVAEQVPAPVQATIYNVCLTDEAKAAAAMFEAAAATTE